MLRHYVSAVVRFLQTEDGPTAVEYAVMLALIILVCIGAVQSVGGSTNATFANPGLNNALSASS